MKTISLAAAVLLAALAVPLRAQAPAGFGGNCMMDELAKICTDKQGTPGFSACAKAHGQEAMATCQGQRRDSAAAQTKKDVAEQSPCAEDVKKFCPGMWPGTPEFSSCMKSHKSDVTPACAAWGRKREGMHRSAANDPCVADAKKLCPGLTVMDGAKFGDCMTSHYEKLSKDCQPKFEGLSKAKHGSSGECMDALKALCPGAEAGTPEMTQCMMTHRADLPASCHKHGK